MSDVPAQNAEFRELTERHRRELTVHCYRMLGSLADAEDMLQETLLRAWQGMAGFEGRASLRTWLYRIATNVCLDALARRRARRLPTFTGTPADPRDPLPAPTSEIDWIEPLPDALTNIELGPEATYTQRESVALAFIAALQTLSPTQRAVLLLRDVLGFSATETAAILETTTAAANSALQRARDTLAKQPAASDVDDVLAHELCGRLVHAWEAGDTGAIVALLRDDALFSMPPFPLFFQGRDAIAAFLTNALFIQGRRFRVLETRANGQPALGIYERDATDRATPRALYVLSFRESAIAAIDAFLSVPSFEPFGLPDHLDDAR